MEIGAFLQTPSGSVVRLSGNTASVTDRAYTGHRGKNLPDDDLGLLDMNARVYLPGSGRFASADTIVPDPADPQSFNRYSYSLNNPLKFRDPSGHCVENYQHDSEYLGTCIEGWNLLGEYYADTYGYEHYPNDYLNDILMTYDIDTIAGMLSYFGVEWDYSLPDRAPITEPAGSDQECNQHQGVMVCSPEGGWPKYYPWTDDDTAWVKQFVTARLKRASISLVTGKLVSFGVGKLISDPVEKWLTTRAINTLIVAPAAVKMYDVLADEYRTRAALSISPSPVPSSTSSTGYFSQFSRSQSDWHPPLVWPR